MCKETVKIRCETINGEEYMNIEDMRKYLDILGHNYHKGRIMAAAYVIMKIKNELGNLL